MTLYSYRAIDAQGKSVKGLQDAANQIDLELHLQHSGLDLISAKHKNNTRGFGGSAIKRADLITFFFNLDQLSRAGVPLLECLTDLRDATDDPAFRDIIAALIEAIANGGTLSQAMSQHPNAFDRVTTSLIHAGEASGKLPDIFRSLTESLKWQDEILSQTRSMMLYPVFVGGVLVAITLFLMIYLVPQLTGFINGMGQEIPLQTRLLLSASALFVDYWYAILAAPLLLLGAYQSALKFAPGLQYHVDNLKLHLWPSGPVLRKVILARFANTFALMYSSGICVLDCLAHSRDLGNNQVISRSLDKAIHEIESGKNLSQSFEQAGIFPALVLRMLKVGEATGKLDHALLNVSYFYDRDVKDSIKRAQVMIEPVMTLLLGLLLGWVMLSVLAPIYDIIGKMHM